jgi:hypothetical protein
MTDYRKPEQLEEYTQIFQQHEEAVRSASTTLRETLHLSFKECLDLKDNLLLMRRHTSNCLEWSVERCHYAYALHAQLRLLDGELSAKLTRQVEQYWLMLQHHPDANAQLKLEVALEQVLARCHKELRDLVQQLHQVAPQQSKDITVEGTRYQEDEI